MFVTEKKDQTKVQLILQEYVLLLVYSYTSPSGEQLTGFPSQEPAATCRICWQSDIMQC